MCYLLSAAVCGSDFVQIVYPTFGLIVVHYHFRFFFFLPSLLLTAASLCIVLSKRAFLVFLEAV